MTFRLRRTSAAWPALLALGLLAGPRAERVAAAEDVSVAEPAVRYPFDPVCPWGRVADGRGLLVRCLAAAEAARLTAASPPAAPPASRAAPARPALESPPPRRVSARRVVLESVGPAIADTGELPEAQRQLSRAGERYVQCVESNGGITASPARVTVRFLVRERGRAEGITVKERSGMSAAAAKCVADVVDRRFVGYPAAPIVGADLSIDFAWEGSGR